jgi:hypothetical protein
MPLLLKTAHTLYLPVLPITAIFQGGEDVPRAAHWTPRGMAIETPSCVHDLDRSVQLAIHSLSESFRRYFRQHIRFNPAAFEGMTL